MKTVLDNGTLSIAVKSLGAELTSIQTKADGTEYLWQGDPAFWTGQSPLLFPIVGVVAGNTYRLGGEGYPLGGHGFARRSEFQPVSTTGQRAVYRLTDSAATLAVYPFRFELEVAYELRGNAVAVAYAVKNADDKAIYFSIGGHPAFNCPLEQGDDFEDYYLQFDHGETLDRQFIGKDGLMEPFTERVLEGGRVLPIRSGMFDRGAWVFEGYRSTSLALRGKHTRKSVKVDFPGFPQLGVWSAPGAPYVCIEPWFGINDVRGAEGDFTRKKGILRLEAGQTFSCEFTITVE